MSVLVVGGGYAGVAAARAAARAGADVAIVDATGRHELLPRLATVAAGATTPGDAWVPLADLVDVEVVPGRVAGVDVGARVLLLDDGRRLPYRTTVLTVGAAGPPPAIPGLREHGRALGGAAQALALRTALEAADALVVVGAGATGVQLAGEVAAAHPGIRVSLVEAGDRLLPAFSPSLGRRAAALLARRGVAVRLGVGLAEVTAEGARLADGTALDGLVVWAGGATARGAALLPAAAVLHGRLVVDPCQQVPGAEGVLAAGDAAATRGPDGTVLPMSAQVAEQAGAVAGRNAARIAAGRAPRPGRVRHRGWVVPLGGGAGVGRLLGIPFSAPGLDRVVPVLHHAIDAKHLLAAGGAGAVLRHRPGAPGTTDAEVAAVAAEAGPQRRAAAV